MKKQDKCDCVSYMPPPLKPVISEIDCCDLDLINNNNN